MTRMTDLEKVQTPEEEAARASPETANTSTIQVGDTVVGHCQVEAAGDKVGR